MYKGLGYDFGLENPAEFSGLEIGFEVVIGARLNYSHGWR